jgi:hypothetical protein
MARELIPSKYVLEQAAKIWQRGDLHRAFLENSACFPVMISLPSWSSKVLLTEFSAVQEAIYALNEQSKKHGFTILHNVVNHRQLGEQKIPVAVEFENETIFLRYVRHGDEFSEFKTLADKTLQRFPTLKNWLNRYPFKLMNFATVWFSLLAVCDYFMQNPRPDVYIRQLDIVGVDTKFIENHTAILTEILDVILPETARDLTVNGLSNHGFERRYGLRYELPQIRLRILDKRLAICGLTDLTLSLLEFNQLELPINTVFITENKINGLAFPHVENAIVIFRLGYAVDLLVNARILQGVKIYYWGDLDSHGFAILSRMRGYFPQTQSFLMDNETLIKFENLWTEEPENKAITHKLANLTVAEQAVFQTLKTHRIRLEQERVSYGYLKINLQKLRQTAP